MKYKLSQQGVATLMMVFNNGFLKMIANPSDDNAGDMSEVFQNLEWFINTDKELVCDNPPIVDLSILNDIIAAEEE